MDLILHAGDMRINAGSVLYFQHLKNIVKRIRNEKHEWFSCFKCFLKYEHNSGKYLFYEVLQLRNDINDIKQNLADYVFPVAHALNEQGELLLEISHYGLKGELKTSGDTILGIDNESLFIAQRGDALEKIMENEGIPADFPEIKDCLHLAGAMFKFQFSEQLTPMEIRLRDAFFVGDGEWNDLQRFNEIQEDNIYFSLCLSIVPPHTTRLVHHQLPALQVFEPILQAFITMCNYAIERDLSLEYYGKTI